MGTFEHFEGSGTLWKDGQHRFKGSAKLHGLPVEIVGVWDQTQRGVPFVRLSMATERFGWVKASRELLDYLDATPTDEKSNELIVLISCLRGEVQREETYIAQTTPNQS